MIKIYLFRHGETDWNVAGRIQCGTDIPLNANGLEQAKINAELLKDKGIEHIYSSPLQRAKKTAEILADKIGVKVDVDKDLRELDGGNWEGKFKSEIIEMFGKDENGESKYEIFSHTRNGGLDYSYEGGETRKQIRNRIVNCILNICKDSPYKVIGVASHGFTLRELIRTTDFEDDSALDNCEVIEAEIDNEIIKIIRRIKG
jgi:broad specificity phosphatase PhoE